MADLHTATVIADVDLTDTVEFPVRLSATSGLLRGTFAKLKTYLKAALKMTDFSDVDISTPPTNGQALVWNSTSSKFKPGSVSSSGGGGSGGAIVPLATVTLGAAAASINFAGIDQTYDDLIIVLTGAGDTAATFTEVRATFNADSGANYDYEFTSVNNATASSSGNVGQAYGLLGWVPAASGVANAASTVELTIPKYAGTSFLKNWFSRAGLRTGTAAANMFKADIWGDWRSTAAITQVTIVPQAGNFATGTKATVYGRKAVVGTGVSVGNGRWAPPRTRLNLNADYNPTDNAWVAIPFTVEAADDKNAHDNVTNPERITIPSGVSRIRATAQITWTGSATAQRYIAIAKNGTTQTAAVVQDTMAPNAWEAGQVLTTGWIDVVAGDYFCIIVNDGNSGASLQALSNAAVGNTNKGTFFEVEFDDNTAGFAASTPVIRSSNITQVTAAASVTPSFPAGTVAGDVVVMLATQDNTINLPAGWTQLDNVNGAQIGGGMFAKVMTSADITAGNVNVTFSSAGNGTVSMVTLVGSTVTGLRGFTSVRSSAGSASVAFSNTTIPFLSTDLMLVIVGNRGTSNNTMTNVTSLQALNAAQSAMVGKFSGTLGQLGFAETAAFSTAGLGYYIGLVGIR